MSTTDQIVTVSASVHDFEKDATTLTIQGLSDGAHVIISAPGAKENGFIFFGKNGQCHIFGFDGQRAIRFGATDHTEDNRR